MRYRCGDVSIAIDAVRDEDTQLHWEPKALLGVAACDVEDVALPFVAQGISGGFFFVECAAV